MAARGVLNGKSMRFCTKPRLFFLLGVLWASPYTSFGLLIGGLGILCGGRMQLRGRAIEFYDGGIKWLIHRLPHGEFILAVTLGHTILGQTAAALDVARLHETLHVRQYERWGPFMLPAYFLASASAWLTGKRFYQDNWFERQARGDCNDSAKD